MDEGLDCGKPLVTGLDSIGPLNSEIRNKKFIDMFASSFSNKRQILLIAVTVTGKRIMRLILYCWYVFRKISHEPVTYK